MHVTSIKIDQQSKLMAGPGFGKLVGRLVGTFQKAMVTVSQVTSAEMWSPENSLLSYLAGYHKSSFQ